MSFKDGTFFNYTYNEMGNITSVCENGELVARYTYDDLSRLVREDNKRQNKTVVFVYDNNGNILVRREYAFTLVNQETLASTNEVPETFLYVYDGDRLVNLNGQTCTYDSMGCPTTYLDKSMTWDAYGRLVNFNSGEAIYAYDSHGRRISKTVGNATTNFIYNKDGNLIYQSNGISFLYDHTGVMGMKYNGNTYFYRKNAQGDVIALLDDTGAAVASYVYDAWGNHKVMVGNIDITDHAEYNTHVGNFNPFRYRSYYFDTETGFYYLPARYYDPSICRFISQDDHSYLDPESINGLNLYAYCGCNPINRYDPDGHAWYDVLGWIGLGLFVVAATVLTAGLAGAVIGGVAGGIIYGAAIGTIALGAVGAAGGAVGGMIYDAVNGNKFGTSIWTWTKAGFGIGAIGGAIIGGAIGGAAAYSVTGLTNTSFWTGLGTNGAEIAANAASQNGLITIGQTFGGKVAQFMTNRFGYAATKYLWASLSKTMASTVAMNSVTLFYGGSIGATSIYMLYENPELVRRGIEIIQQLIGG